MYYKRRSSRLSDQSSGHSSVHHAQSGFTLVEVMVALAVVAISLAALMNVGTQYTNSASHMKLKTLAQWIAENKAAEYQIDDKYPSASMKQGSVNMAGQEWRWQAKVSNTVDKRLRRLDIKVILDDGDFSSPLATLTSFKGQPQK